ncbi:MAG: DNA-processing protein DprA [Solirubrobacterales bacterium]
MSLPHACPTCLRRPWLLELLASYIEHLHNPGADLLELLRLDDERLTAAVAPDVADHLLARARALPEQMLEREIESAGCWAICHHDKRYPRSLQALGDPPPALICRGDPAILAPIARGESAAVVGDRQATAYGREVARTIGRDLAAGGVTVIGGIDFGIDCCVQRGALDAGRPVAVLPCGVDVAYPCAQRSLWRRLQEHGLLVSELPPGATPWGWAQAASRRLLAALAQITVLVEAQQGSLALAAAHAAAALDRDLGAVPGPVTSSASQGTNGLLAHGALVIRDAADVANALAESRRRGATPGARSAHNGH